MIIFAKLIRNKDVFINIALRFSVLVSKFFFIFLAAKYLTLPEMGTYGIFVATVTYSMYLIGFDFYTFSNRAFVQNIEERSLIASKQLSFNVLSLGLIVFPVFLLFFSDAFSPLILLLFSLVVISEYLGQEVGRLLIASGRVLAASSVLFIRSALWSYIIVLLMLFRPELISIEVVLISWMLSSWLALIVGFFCIKNIFIHNPFTFKVDYKWVINGLKVSGVLFVGTLLSRAVFTGDRLLLDLLESKDIVGVYAVYIGLCNVFMTFSDSAVFQFSYPKQITNVKDKNKEEVLRRMKLDTFNVLGIFVLMLFSYYISLELLFDFIGKPEYLQFINYFWVLLLSFLFLVLSYVPHYVVYAANEDRKILKSHILQFFSFFMSFSVSYLFFELNVFLSVAFAMLVSSLVMFMAKVLYCYQVLNVQSKF